MRLKSTKVLTGISKRIKHGNKRILIFGALLLICVSFGTGIVLTNRIVDTGSLVEIPNSVYPKVRGMSPSSNNTQQDQLMGVRIDFKLQDKGSLDAFIRSQADPNSPNYRNYQIPKQLLDQTTIPEEIYNRAISYYTQRGLKIIAKTQSRSMLAISGTRHQLEKVFHVSINNYFIDGAIYCRANDRNPLVPADIAQYIQSIEMNSCNCSGSHGTKYPITC